VKSTGYGFPQVRDRFLPNTLDKKLRSFLLLGKKNLGKNTEFRLAEKLFVLINDKIMSYYLYKVVRQLKI